MKPAMPKTPTGARRPADVVGNAVRVMKVATGEIEERPAKGVSGGRRGGKERAAALSPEERRDIAKVAAKARWKKAR